MKIGVLGLWHLGCVTSACLARNFQVVGLDFDSAVVESLKGGRATIFEPGLDDLIQQGLASGQLAFSAPEPKLVRELDFLWLTYDTPVDENDVSDVEFVLKSVRQVVADMKDGSLVVISSQLPVGTCRKLEQDYAGRGIGFASVPENLRLGQALEIFTRPDRVLAGVRNERDRKILAEVLGTLDTKIVWMSPESAEMSKHAINSFLALSITFMNEIARLCELTGADASEVSEGLKSESRIGPKAYLSPGAAFAGGTLARDVVTLTGIAGDKGEKVDVIPAIQASNEQHRLWAWRKLQMLFPSLAGRKITLLGLTYKPQTDTLRRSSAVELAMRVADAGGHVRAWDPVVRSLPAELKGKIELAGSALDAVRGAEALVVCTPWPEFRQENWQELVGAMEKPRILDAARFLQRQLAGVAPLEYFAVGIPQHA